MEETKYSTVYCLGSRSESLSHVGDFYKKTTISKVREEDPQNSMGIYPIVVKVREKLSEKELISYLKDFIAFLEKPKKDVEI